MTSDAETRVSLLHTRASKWFRNCRVSPCWNVKMTTNQYSRILHPCCIGVQRGTLPRAPRHVTLRSEWPPAFLLHRLPFPNNKIISPRSKCERPAGNLTRFRGESKPCPRCRSSKLGGRLAVSKFCRKQAPEYRGVQIAEVKVSMHLKHQVVFWIWRFLASCYIVVQFLQPFQEKLWMRPVR